MFITSATGPTPVSRFLDGTYLIATLPTASLNPQKYAWVTDLHDGQPDLVISDGTFWKPVRPLAVKNITNANTSITLTPLVNSPTVIMQGTLTLQRTTSIDTINAYPGAKFRVKREASGLFNKIIQSGIGGATIGTLALNSWADFEFNGTVWVQTASGGLL